MTWPEPPQYYDPPKVGYKVLLQKPQYEVIYPDPSLTEVVGNMRSGHWTLVAGMASAGAALGYWKGYTTSWQRPSMWFGAALLGKTGLAWAMLDSAYRLMGLKPNHEEVKALRPGRQDPEKY